MTKKETKQTETAPTKIELSPKDQFIEIISNALAILMLFAFFLKVLFF